MPLIRFARGPEIMSADTTKRFDEMLSTPIEGPNLIPLMMGEPLRNERLPHPGEDWI